MEAHFIIGYIWAVRKAMEAHFIIGYLSLRNCQYAENPATHHSQQQKWISWKIPLISHLRRFLFLKKKK